LLQDDGAIIKVLMAARVGLISNGMVGAYVFSLAIDPLDTSTIYAGTSDGIFKSINGGRMRRGRFRDPDPYIPQVTDL
jgi:hypothetical protein